MTLDELNASGFFSKDYTNPQHLIVKALEKTIIHELTVSHDNKFSTVTLTVERLVWPPKENPEAWREEYRKKQAAGVKFDSMSPNGKWHKGDNWSFADTKECYREVPQPTIPHAKERALYWSQRAAGTNEVWQVAQGDECFADIAVDQEPQWQIACQYRVKPKTVTYYFCLMKFNSCGLYEAKVFSSVEHAQNYEHAHQCTIIGDIESREVEVG